MQTMTQTAAPTVAFTQMKDGTRAEYAFLQTLEHAYIRGLPGRLLAALERLGEGIQGYQISRLEHSLQSATRAEADGADVDMVVATLLHDIGDDLAPENHSQFAASILRPYVRPEVTWVVEKHGLFQMQYYGHHYDRSNTGHLALKDHPWFASCQRFCECYDQASFDPAYASKPLSYFAPMVAEVFGRRAYGFEE